MKYPWLNGENPDKTEKWGAYTSEKREFLFAREIRADGYQPTMEAALMDWADDITYSIHDLKDFYRAGRMPLHLLGNRDPQERHYFFQDVFERRHADKPEFVQRRRDLEEAFTDIIVSTFPPIQAYNDSEKQRIGSEILLAP